MNILNFGRDALGIDHYSVGQQTILLASQGENLNDDQAAWFEAHAGRAWPGPGEPPPEIHVITGRQSGKTGYVAATEVLYASFDPATVEGLGSGYKRDVVLLAPTQRQARIAYQRVRGLVGDRVELRTYLASEPTQHEIHFDFGVRIGVWAAKGSHLRGIQPRLLLLDEACFLPAEGARADAEIIEAVRPGMAMVPNGQIMTISSPWIESGVVYEAFRRRAELDDVLVFQCASWELNPHIPQAFLDRERRRDPEVFRREFAGEFIGSISAYLPAEAVEACVVSGRSQLPPDRDVQYTAAIDQAYRQDIFALAIAHREEDCIVIDRVRGWPRGTGLDTLLPELIAELEPYRVRTVLGDQFGSVPFRELVSGYGLHYDERTFTSASKPNMYAALKNAVTSGAIKLLDHATSLRELRTLEARAMPTGAVRIEAPSGAGFSDDFADTLAILAHELRPTVYDSPAYTASSTPLPGLYDQIADYNRSIRDAPVPGMNDKAPPWERTSWDH